MIPVHKSGAATLPRCPALFGFVLAFLTSASAFDFTTNHPFAGVSWHLETRENPPNRLFIAEVDLKDPRLRIRVAPGGPDPDGPGRWQTTLMRPTDIAQREGFDLVVNGDFFRARGLKDAEGTNSKYATAVWGAVLGPAMTDGKTWATANTNRPCLVVHKDARVSIEQLASPASDDFEVVAGNTMLVRDGTLITHTNLARHPRTLAGLNADRTRLWLVVVDGRKPGIATGMSYDESARLLLGLGCRDALNLDGGGSSLMAIRDRATGKLQILNEPTDGHERPVASALGVSVNAR